MRGADALIAALEAHGADTVFGVPGGAALPLYDALAGSSIRHVLMRHEAAAGHAAEGWARVPGRPGVALATSGPPADRGRRRVHGLGAGRLRLRAGRHAPARD